MADPKTILKADLVPALRKLGFKGSFPHFRRINKNRIELLSVQFDKWGTGKFVVELASAPLGDLETYWGEVIPQSKVKSNDVAQRLRLGSNGQNDDHWFDLGRRPNQIIATVLEMMTKQGEEYFRSQTPDK